MNLRCAKCGENMTCEANAKHCWCMELTLPVETVQSWAEQYEGCLCAICIQELLTPGCMGIALPNEPSVQLQKRLE